MINPEHEQAQKLSSQAALLLQRANMAEARRLFSRAARMEKQALGMRGAYECLIEALIKASINVADTDAKVSSLQAELNSLSSLLAERDSLSAQLAETTSNVVHLFLLRALPADLSTIW